MILMVEEDSSIDQFSDKCTIIIEDINIANSNKCYEPVLIGLTELNNLICLNEMVQ